MKKNLTIKPFFSVMLTLSLIISVALTLTQFVVPTTVFAEGTTEDYLDYGDITDVPPISDDENLPKDPLDTNDGLPEVIPPETIVDCKHDEGLFSDSTYFIPPTCHSCGTVYWRCKKCYELIEVAPQEPLDHEFDLINDATVVRAATPTKDGILHAQCQFSDCDYEKDFPIYKPVTIKLSDEKFMYNGYTRKPKIKVYDSNNKIISDVYYDVYYPKCTVDVGKYKLLVEFCPSKDRREATYYKGSMEASFEIVGNGISNTITLAQKPARITKVKIKKVSNKKITLTWKRLSNSNGYQISKSTSKKKIGKIYTIKKQSVCFKKITVKKGKKYYYKIRAYKMVNGKKIYGNWSKIKIYKLK